jgi:hypothetical protein
MISKVLAKINSNFIYRNAFFVILSSVIIVPFLVQNKMPLIADGWFHIPRIHEIAENIRHGKLLPDIAYFTFNNQGYGVNFFYPYLINYPIALLGLLTSNLVSAFLIFNIVIHVTGLNIAYWVYRKLTGQCNYALLFAFIYIFGTYNFNYELLCLKLYNQNIAFIFLPICVVGITQLIVGDFVSWKWPTTIGVSLSILSHMLTTYLLIIFTIIVLLLTFLFKRNVFSVDRVKTWCLALGQIILATAIFVFPMIEQKSANTWLTVPALNLSHEGGMLASSTGLTTWTKRLHDALKLQDVMILAFFALIILCLLFRAYNRLSLFSLFGVTLTYLIESRYMPYEYLQQYDFVDMIQFLSRFDGFLYLFISLFITSSLYQLSKKTNALPSRFAHLTKVATVGTISLQLLLLTIISALSFGYIDTPTAIGSPENIKTGLQHSNFGYESQDSWAGYFHLNGHMDYRPEKQMMEIRNYPGSYHIKNGDSYAPVVNFESDYLRETNDLVENAVFFDGEKKLGHYNANDFTFSVSNIPDSTSEVRTSIAFLKGFEAHDSTGNELKTYKAYNGTLAIATNKSDEVLITYNKTPFHLLGIVVSLMTWAFFSYQAYSKKFG